MASIRRAFLCRPSFNSEFFSISSLHNLMFCQKEYSWLTTFLKDSYGLISFEYSPLAPNGPTTQFSYI